MQSTVATIFGMSALVTADTEQITGTAGTVQKIGGVVMDHFCVERLTALDNANLVIADFPYKHTVFCLVTPPECLASGYCLMRQQSDKKWKCVYTFNTAEALKLKGFFKANEGTHPLSGVVDITGEWKTTTDFEVDTTKIERLATPCEVSSSESGVAVTGTDAGGVTSTKCCAVIDGAASYSFTTCKATACKGDGAKPVLTTEGVCEGCGADQAVASKTEGDVTTSVCCAVIDGAASYSLTCQVKKCKEGFDANTALTSCTSTTPAPTPNTLPLTSSSEGLSCGGLVVVTMTMAVITTLWL